MYGLRSPFPLSSNKVDTAIFEFLLCKSYVLANFPPVPYDALFRKLQHNFHDMDWKTVMNLNGCPARYIHWNKNKRKSASNTNHIIIFVSTEANRTNHFVISRFAQSKNAKKLRTTIIVKQISSSSISMLIMILTLKCSPVRSSETSTSHSLKTTLIMISSASTAATSFW